jgi:hypothetical protein
VRGREEREERRREKFGREGGMGKEGHQHEEMAQRKFREGRRKEARREGGRKGAREGGGRTGCKAIMAETSFFASASSSLPTAAFKLVM